MCIYIWVYVQEKKKKKPSSDVPTHTHVYTVLWKALAEGEKQSREIKGKDCMELLFLGRGTNRKTAISRGFEWRTQWTKQQS